VAALSGKRSGPSPPIDVREAAAELATVRDDEVAALVFGPEDTGLTHEEIALCGRRVWIPAHPAQPSLNLSHAVMVASYEVLRARRPPGELRHRARHEEKQAMLRLFKDGLRALRALPPQNMEGYFLEWEAIFSRADLTPREVKLLEHMSRKMIMKGTAMNGTGARGPGVRGDEDAAEGGGRDRIK
jgi:tRNA C32,U32 (ribose-2'-O)-methylase TrmJ